MPSGEVARRHGWIREALDTAESKGLAIIELTDDGIELAPLWGRELHSGSTWREGDGVRVRISLSGSGWPDAIDRLPDFTVEKSGANGGEVES